MSEVITVGDIRRGIEGVPDDTLVISANHEVDELIGPVQSQRVVYKLEYVKDPSRNFFKLHTTENNEPLEDE